MTHEIISRAEAQSQGLKRYFTGIPCTHNHISERAVSNKNCIACQAYRKQQWRQANVEEDRARNQARRDADPERNRANKKRYRRNNPMKMRAKDARKHAIKLQRTPTWADLKKIEQFYLETPEGYHVDHDYPLQGELVSGLHVENNLRHLTASDNLSKSNSFQSQFT